MKRVLVVGRQGSALELVIFTLRKNFHIPVIIKEQSRKARLRKLKKMLYHKKLLEVVFLPFDILTLGIYHTLLNHKIAKLAPYKKIVTHNDSKILHVSDINTLYFHKLISDVNFDCTLVFGTSILNANTISKMPKPIINFHGSMVPWYRNVHGDFWATVMKDKARWGTSFLLLGEGVDDGPVIYQKKNGIAFKKSISTNAALNFLFGVSHLNWVISNFLDKKLSPQPQENSFESSQKLSPSFIDWVRFRVFP